MLNTFLTDNSIHLNYYFLLEDLIQAVENYAEKNYLFETGNSDIICPDRQLKLCFDKNIIFRPDLKRYCLKHLKIISKSELLNKNIRNNFFVDCPSDIIYNDPSSLFWIHPSINRALTKNAKLTFSWNNLCTLFTNFINTPNAYVTPIHDSMFLINQTSIFADLFKFKYFHIDQVSIMLKQVTIFLGRTSTLDSICPKLKFKNISPATLLLLEDVINSTSTHLPYISSNIQL